MTQHQPVPTEADVLADLWLRVFEEWKREQAERATQEPVQETGPRKPTPSP